MDCAVTVTDSKGRPNYMADLIRVANNILQGDYNNWIINMPPRLGKSRYFCLYFIAYALALYPRAEFIYTTYNENLAKKHAFDLKAIMQSAYYRNNFSTRLKNRVSWSMLRTTSEGTVKIGSILGDFTGFGAGRQMPEGENIFTGAIVIDDPHEAGDAYSRKELNRVCDKFTNSIMSRRNVSYKTPIIAVGQRISEHDLFAYLEERHPSEHWKKMSLPALTEESESICPERLSRETLYDLEKENNVVFMAQYQQTPLSQIGNIFNSEDFLFWETRNEDEFVPAIGEDLIIAVDPNGRSRSSNDETAIVTGRVFFDMRYPKMPLLLIEDIVSKKYGSVRDITDAVINKVQYYDDKVKKVYIEVHTNGNAILEGVREHEQSTLSSFKLVPTTRHINKRVFMHAAAAFVSAGRIYIKKNRLSLYAPLFEEIKDITMDTDCKDDVADALSELIYQLMVKRSVLFYPDMPIVDQSYVTDTKKTRGASCF